MRLRRQLALLTGLLAILAPVWLAVAHRQQRQLDFELEEVVGRHDPAAVARLLRAGADARVNEDLGPGYGHGVALDALLSNDPESLDLLLRYGADPNFREGASGYTLLMLAASKGQRSLVEVLLRRGADPCIETDGKTAADCAAKYPALARMLQCPGPRSRQ